MFASGGKDSGLADIVFIVVFLGVAYLITQWVVSYLKKRRVILGGAEYIIIGLGLKYASFLGDEWLITPQRMAKMSPVLTLMIGVLGLVVGLQANQNRQPKLDRDAVAGALSLGLTPMVMVIAGFVLWYQYLGSGLEIGDIEAGTMRPWIAAALVLGVTALLSDAELVKNVIAHSPKLRKGRVSRYLYNSSWLSELLGIILFGIVLCVLRKELDMHITLPNGESTSVVLNAAEWLIINLLLGTVLGLIFVLFLRNEQDDEGLFLAGIGILVFACGLAFYLQFSALFINFVIGFCLGRFTLTGSRLLEKLYPFVEPCYVVILIFAGIYFQLPPWQGWILAVGYIGLRFGGKLLGGLMFYENTKHQHIFSSSTSYGLLAPGALTMAMSLKYAELFNTGDGNPLAATVMTCVLLTFIVHQFLGPKLIHNVLVDASEIRQDQSTEVLTDLIHEKELVWSDEELEEDQDVRGSSSSSGGAG